LAALNIIFIVDDGLFPKKNATILILKKPLNLLSLAKNSTIHNLNASHNLKIMENNSHPMPGPTDRNQGDE
jgi:hypothetical protein